MFYNRISGKYMKGEKLISRQKEINNDFLYTNWDPPNLILNSLFAREIKQANTNSMLKQWLPEDRSWK